MKVHLIPKKQSLILYEFITELCSETFTDDEKRVGPNQIRLDAIYSVHYEKNLSS